MIQRDYQMNNGFSTGEEDSRGTSDQICCLLDEGERCRRSAGNAAYSKKIQKTVRQRNLALNIDPQARHTYICDFHKTMIQCARAKQRRNKDSEEDSNEAEGDSPEIDWYQLQVNTLRRYKKHYKVSTKPGMNKGQLAESIQKHFRTLPVNEKEVLTYFIYMVRTNGNKLDHKNGISTDSMNGALGYQQNSFMTHKRHMKVTSSD